MSNRYPVEVVFNVLHAPAVSSPVMWVRGLAVIGAILGSAIVGVGLPGCGGDDPTDIPPPPEIPIEPAPPPLTPDQARRGTQGLYTTIGGDWSYHPEAYTYRYGQAFDRLTVFTAPRTRCRALRITLPPGWGPPLAGLEHQLAIVKVELYDRAEDDVTSYEHDPRTNLARPPRVRAVTSDEPDLAVPPDATLRNRAAAWMSTDHWASSIQPGPHWIQYTFSEPITWNQLVLYWPVVRMPTEGMRDVSLDDGLRARNLIVQSYDDTGWSTVPVREVGRGADHDGHFVAEWLGLDITPPSRLDHLHRYANWRSLSGPDATATPAPDETVIGSGWTIRVPTGAPDPVLAGAHDLRRFLIDEMGCGSIALAEWPPEETSFPSRSIVLGDLARRPATLDAALGSDGVSAAETRGAGPESHVLLVEPDRIWAFGHDPLGTRFAACRLEERLVTRGAPFVHQGRELRRPAFYPRAVSGVSFGMGGPDGLGFPDGYLSLMAHYYVDAIYLFQAGLHLDATGVVGSSLDPALTGDPDRQAQLRRLIDRTARHGLGVYWCVSLPGALPADVYDRHPEIRGDDRPHVICLSTAAGREFVIDSAQRIARTFPGLRGLVVLRSELSHTCGGRGTCAHCRRVTTPDEDPAQRIFHWVARAVHEVAPGMEVVAFDWRAGGLPAPDETRLPPDVGLWLRTDRMVGDTPENDIRDVEPMPSALTTLRNHVPERRLWVEGQPTHAFPTHAQPELAVADLVWSKWTRLREVAAEQPPGSPLLGFAAGNGSGFFPCPMTDLILRTLMWDPLPDSGTALEDVATRWFGSRAAPRVRTAWWHFSQALREHARFEKYLTRRSWIQVPGIQHPDLNPDQLASLRALCGEWEDGVEILEEAVSTSDPARRAGAQRSTDRAEAVLCAFRSSLHAAEWRVTFGDMQVASVTGLTGEAHQAAVGILSRELANTERSLELVIRNPQIAQHPYYRNWFGLPTFAAKQEALRVALGSAPGTAPFLRMPGPR